MQEILREVEATEAHLSHLMSTLETLINQKEAMEASLRAETEADNEMIAKAAAAEMSDSDQELEKDQGAAQGDADVETKDSQKVGVSVYFVFWLM